MATARRRQSLTVVQQLLEQPHDFEFFQAVRLLERTAALDVGTEKFACDPVAQLAPPNREVVHFKSNPSLAFSAADIKTIVARDTHKGDDSSAPDKQWLMDVTFMGLTGSQGVMPHYLSEVVLKEMRQKNNSLRDYLDIFNHRSISMYYQAWHKYQLPVNYERNRQRGSRQTDLFSQALTALAGLGLNELNYRLPIPDTAMAGMAGLQSRNICTADSLRRMISHYFELDTQIEQFQGQWQELPEDILCRLPGPESPSGINNRLGGNAILGTSCFHAQSKFTVVIAPLPYDKFMSIAPGTQKLEALKSFIHFTAGIELDFDISVTLAQDVVPPVQLVDDEHYQPLLGWNTHMSLNNDDNELVEIILCQDIGSPDDGLPLAS